MSFQEYLKSIGFKPFSYDFINGKQVECECRNENFFSTMSPLYVTYKKDNIVITYGLNEHGLPPTIIHPYPNVIDKKTGLKYIRLGKNTISQCALYDRALSKHGNEKVYDSMINGTILYV